MAQAAIELVIEARNRTGLGRALRELWAFREVVWAFAERDVRLKYKQAVLGVAWSVLQPLAFLGIFVIIFGKIGRVSAGSIPYPAFALTTLVPWFFVQTAVSFGAQALLMDSALLRKVYFPREASILGAVLSAGLDFAFGFVLLIVLGPFLGIRLTWTALLAVPLVVALAVLASGVAVALGALNVYYRDFRYVLPLFLQLWMFASPVAYPLTAVPERWRSLYVLANPAAGILDGFRQTLAEGRFPDLGLLLPSIAMAFAVAWVGYSLFKMIEPGFADVI
jgi:lipopolysaccharide transport system permease protein